METFGIKWSDKIPDSNVGPATDEEIVEAMKIVNERAKAAKPGAVIGFKLRTEVAKTVAKGINTLSSGSAAIDLGDDKHFDKDKGIFVSWLYVAKDYIILNNYINGL